MSSQGFSYNEERLAALAEQVLEYARTRGASACETDVSEGYGQSVTVRKGEVETIEYNRDKGLGVTVYLGQKRGHASSSDFSAEALRAAVDAALSIARLTAEDPCAGLPEPQLLARDKPDLDLFHPWELSVEEGIDMARRCEAAAFAVSPMVKNSEGATVSTHSSHFVSANSLGFMGGFAASRHYVSCAVIAGESDAMQRDDWYSSKRDWRELADPEAVGSYAGHRALSRLGARRVPTCTVPVLFEAPLACGLLGNFVYATSGGSLYRKSSFLLNSLGKQIFAPHIHIAERPHIPKGMGSTPFDDDGVTTRDREVVQKGVLNGYFLGTYSARKLGMQTTGNAGGAHNLILAGGKRDFRAMLELMGRGLLVTEVLGHGVNYVTGDYSRGAAGYWVEDGEIVHPVQEITIAGNLRDMFKRIVEVGADTMVRGSKQSGSVLVEAMRVAGE
jgi:PmbA protein